MEAQQYRLPRRVIIRIPFCLPYRIGSRECLYTCVNLENYRVFVVKVVKVILISCRDPKYEYPASGGVQVEIQSDKAC